MSVEAIRAALAVPEATAPGATSTATDAGEFEASLSSMIRQVESTGAEANTAVSEMLAGRGDVHTALIALQHADTTFQLTVQIRNKLVQAYQDVMRMPI